MNIETIFNEWDKDGRIDQNDISNEAANIPKLHNKYYRYYIGESLRLKKLRADLKKLTKEKTSYYRGEMSQEELKEKGWPPYQIKLLKTDVPHHVESDDEIISLSLRIGLQEEIASYLESIVKQINNRNFQLNTIVSFEKFRSGG